MQERGDFDVEASTVIQANKDIINKKLYENESNSGCHDTLPLIGEEPLITTDEKVINEYAKFLTHCNHSDTCDILHLVHEAKGNNTELQTELDSNNYILTTLPTNEVEVRFV